MKNLFAPIYLNIVKRLSENHNVNTDQFDIDYSNENPNSLQIQINDESITIGQCLDAIIYCLATIDIDPIEYTITENEEHNLFTFELTQYH